MATIRYAARWRPPVFRSTQETIISGTPAVPAGGPFPASPSTESRVETLQLIVFDLDQFAPTTPGNPYVPGTTATERHLAIVEEKTIQLAVSTFPTGGITAGKIDTAKTAWDTAKANQIAAWQADPLVMNKIFAAIGRHLSDYTIINP